MLTSPLVLAAADGERRVHVKRGVGVGVGVGERAKLQVLFMCSIHVCA
jgi:hypothetical protein